MTSGGVTEVRRETDFGTHLKAVLLSHLLARCLPVVPSTDVYTLLTLPSRQPISEAQPVADTRRGARGFNTPEISVSIVDA